MQPQGMDLRILTVAPDVYCSENPGLNRGFLPQCVELSGKRDIIIN